MLEFGLLPTTVAFREENELWVDLFHTRTQLDVFNGLVSQLESLIWNNDSDKKVLLAEGMTTCGRIEDLVDALNRLSKRLAAVC